MFFWSMVFVLTIAGSCTHLYFLVSSYLQYNFYETITNDNAETPLFPHVTICDPYAVSVLSLNHHLHDNMQSIYKMALTSYLALEYATENNRVFRYIKVTFKKELLVEYTSKSSLYV